MKQKQKESKREANQVQSQSLRTFDAESAKLDKAFSDRLVEIRATLKVAQPEMDRILKIGKGSWQRYESRGVKPGGEVIAKLAALGLDANWILTGRGSLYIPDSGLQQSASDGQGGYSIYKVTGRIEPDIVRDAALVVERRLADQSPELRADTIVDLASTMQRQRDKDREKNRADAQEMLKQGPPGPRGQGGQQ